MQPRYSPDFVEWVRAQPMSLRAERARDLLLERGTVTTGELNQLGYDHPPRVIGDLKDAGVVVRSEMVIAGGRRMAQYTLVDTREPGMGSTAQRRQLPKAFRESLYAKYGHHCAVCGGRYSARELQTDHRVPFRIGGDPEDPTLADFMPLCASDNRAKSWTCEHCVNWERRDPEMCRSCFWASPVAYTHIAGADERRLAVAFQGGDADAYDRVARAAAEAGQTVEEWVSTRFQRLL